MAETYALSGDFFVVETDLGDFSNRPVAPASPSEFKPTARTQVFGPKAWTAPVFANGLIYRRNGRGELVVFNLK